MLRILFGVSPRRIWHGENGSNSGRSSAPHRLYQFGRDHTRLSGESHTDGIGGNRPEQCPRARIASTGDDVLRHRPSLVYAGLATGGVALPAGRSAVVVWPAGGDQGD